MAEMKLQGTTGSVPLLMLLVALPLFISAASAAKMGESCLADKDCDAGLHCDPCVASGSGRRCTRIKPSDPQSKVKGLPFNKYSWLTTHNSFALRGQASATGAAIVAPTNQEDSVTAQLNNGVRGLMLDMYDFEGGIWLCHSFQGQCYNFTAFQPAVNVLKEIRAFLKSNPSEIVTIFIEDYVTAPQGLTKVFDAAGLRRYWFPVSRMPKNGGDWPLISDMIGRNERLLVFTSKSAKEDSEGIAYEWRYVVENQYGDGGLKVGVCRNRAESSAMNSLKASLVLTNFFPDNPDPSSACRDNSAPLVDMINTCHNLSANRWSNFIAVDYYKRSNGGGAPEAVDIANGRLACGCDNIAYCQANAPFGTCDVPPLAKPKRASPAPAPASHRALGPASSAGKLLIWTWFYTALPLLTVFFCLAAASMQVTSCHSGGTAS